MRWFFPRCVAVLSLLVCIAALGVQAADEVDERAEARLKRLTERFNATSGDKAAVRQDLLAFARVFAGSRYAVQAAEMLGKLPSVLDRLDPSTIAPLEKFTWQPKELVGILGEHRGRHGAAASCVAFSPDASILASGGGTFLRIWDPATMRLQHFVSNGTYTHAMAFSRDGKFLVTGGGAAITLWSMPEGGKAPVATSTAGSGSAGIYGIAFAPNGKTIAVACYDNATRLFKITGTKLEEQAVMTGHTKAIGAVAYTPDGKTLASASHDQTIRLWNATEEIPPEKGHLQGLSGAVTALTFNPNGSILAAGCGDGKINLWRMPAAGKPHATFFHKNSGGISYLAFSSSGQILAAACADGTIRLWNVAIAKPVEQAKLEGHVGGVSGVIYSPDKKLLASSGSDWTVRTWDLTASPRPKERFVPWSHLSYCYTASFSPDCATLATGSYDTILRLWDLDRPEPRTRNFLKPEISYVYQVAYSPNGKTLAARGHSGTIKQWDTAGKALRSIAHSGVPGSLQFSPDSRQIMTYNGNNIYLFDAATGSPLQTFAHPEKPVNSYAWSPDGKTLLSTTGAYLYDKNGKLVLQGGNYVYTDCRLRQWEVESGKLTATIEGFTVPVHGANFTPDGKYALYYLPNDTQMRQREAANLMSSETKAFPGIPPGFSFSPDGRMGLVWINGYGYKVYELATGKVLFGFSLPEQIGSVNWASDNRHMAVTLGTGVVYIFRLGPPAIKG